MSSEFSHVREFCQFRAQFIHLSFSQDAFMLKASKDKPHLRDNAMKCPQGGSDYTSEFKDKSGGRRPCPETGEGPDEREGSR
jgi:hypothetical protein